MKIYLCGFMGCGKSTIGPKLAKKLGFKFNFEQILLPSEVCKARGKHFKIIFGDPISWQSLKQSGKSAKSLAAEIRQKVYDIPTA